MNPPPTDESPQGGQPDKKPRIGPAPGQTSARTWTAKQLEVIATAPVHAGIDGQAVDLSSPLRFVIRAETLRVRISSSHAGVSRSARLT